MNITRVAIIGTQGVPASYGGFESLVENLLGENCPDDVQYTVFCSSVDLSANLREYKKAGLRYIPLHANGIQSIPYDIVSMLRVLKGYDVILVLGVSGCMFMPALRKLTKSKIIVNIDGLEHRREKWGRAARWLLRNSEALAVKYADVVIADNQGIKDYVADTYGKEAELIAYGGDHALRSVEKEKQHSILASYGVDPAGYAVTVCRIEPENNCHVILEAFSQTNLPLIFVGNWDHSEWSRNLRHKYDGVAGIHTLDAIYDLDILYTLRSNAAIYLHGHSAGGTNPSLVEAMHFGIPIAAWNVVYNRETTHNSAYYFDSPDTLLELANRTDLDGSAMADIAGREYTWSKIAEKYVNLFR